MKLFVMRSAMGLALLAAMATAQPSMVSAQGGGASGAARFCEAELVPYPFATVGECVSAFATAENPGDAEGVGECKTIFALYGIPQRFFGECVRDLQGGR